MFRYLRISFQLLIAVALLAPGLASAQPADEEAGFATAEDYPWVGWQGPIADGLHGLRFGTDGHEANRVMRDKGMSPIKAREYTLRFEGDVLGAQAELMGEFTTPRPSQDDSRLRVIQIRWLFRGLAATSINLFERLDALLQSRYGTPVLQYEDPVSSLENGAGKRERMYYGTNARAWLEVTAIRRHEYAVLIRLDCPQLPDPRDDD